MKANFTKASLIVPESRIVADLLLHRATTAEWRQAIEKENRLQKKSRSSGQSYANLARARLLTMDAELWEIVRSGTLREATDAVLAATVKFSPLFGDFLRLILRDEFRRFSSELPAAAWEHYIENCERAHPEAPHFTDNTRSKLKQNAMRMLHEAGFLIDTKSLRLRPHRIEPRVQRYLEAHHEKYAMECLLICP